MPEQCLQEQLLEQRRIGHAEGQQHAVDDVNAGRIDDLIVPRLQAAERARDEATDEILALRSVFAQQAVYLEDFIVKAENEWRDWGHMRYAILAAMAALVAGAKKYAKGEPAYRNTVAKAQVKVLQAALDEARAALFRYGQHEDRCPAWPQFTSHFAQATKIGACNCGFAQTLAASRETP